MRGKTFYGWWVTAASFLTFGIAVGLPYYNMPFFYDYFQREFHWSKEQITFGFPLAALLTLWIGPVLVPRFSPRKLILVAPFSISPRSRAAADCLLKQAVRFSACYRGESTLL